MSKPLFFGAIAGISIGQKFSSRVEVMNNRLHRTTQAGIDGNKQEGASAIVLSAGYEDDLDLGYEIIYTGAGGQKGTKGQLEDQSFENPYNMAMLKSMDHKIPVRVIRGANHKSPDSPTIGYAYGGLYDIVDAFYATGKSGFKVCRFRMVFSDSNDINPSLQESLTHLDHSIRTKRRNEVVSYKVVRDPLLAREIKSIYNNKCQICGEKIPVKSGWYSEAAHIKPLGKPHNGDDSLANLLCLCPNHHVMFDNGSIAIDANFNLLGTLQGKLTRNERHQINLEHIEYHRKSHGYH